MNSPAKPGYLCKDNCGFYLCNDLDCGFYYHYKKRGPSKHRPIIEMMVPVVGLDKKVRVKLIGMGEIGLNKLLDHGHEGYIFPIHLFNKPYQINPKLDGEEDERWQKLLASVKGVPFVSTRKKYVLVGKDGVVVRTKLCNEAEWADTLDYQRGWKERHPDEEPMEWKLYVNDLYIGKSQQATHLS